MTTLICLPNWSESFNAAIALSAISCDGTVAKPNPRDLPVFRSVTITQSLAWYCENKSFND